MARLSDTIISKKCVWNPCWEYARIDTMAEWSKAVALGAIPKGRGFEPHWCQLLIFKDSFFCLLAENDATLAMTLGVSAKGRVLPCAMVGALDIAHLPYSAVSRMMKGYACGS